MKLNLDKYFPSIKNKLSAGFAAVAVLCLLVGLTGWFGSYRLNNFIVQTGEISLPSLQAILLIKKEQNAIKAARKNLLNPTLNFQTRQQQYDFIHASFVESRQNQ